MPNALDIRLFPVVHNSEYFLSTLHVRERMGFDS